MDWQERTFPAVVLAIFNMRCEVVLVLFRDYTSSTRIYYQKGERE
jgi:hypothetical protein